MGILGGDEYAINVTAPEGGGGGNFPLPQSVPRKVAVAGASVMQQWRKQLWAGCAVVVVSTVVVLVLVVLQAWIFYVAVSTAAIT